MLESSSPSLLNTDTVVFGESSKLNLGRITSTLPLEAVMFHSHVGDGVKPEPVVNTYGKVVTTVLFAHFEAVCGRYK